MVLGAHWLLFLSLPQLHYLLLSTFYPADICVLSLKSKRLGYSLEKKEMLPQLHYHLQAGGRQSLRGPTYSALE